jgi:hypothetical protein
MGSGGTSQRVKRGFHRIGLLGLVPGVITAVVILGYQYFLPTGGYQAASGGTSIELEAGKEWSVTPWASTIPGTQKYPQSESEKSAVENALQTSASLPPRSKGVTHGPLVGQMVGQASKAPQNSFSIQILS